MDGTSDQAASNWGNVYMPGDPNNAPLARSNFDPGHRITLTATLRHPVGEGGRSRSCRVFYSGQSGRPYTLRLQQRRERRQPQHGNDLVYIPISAIDAHIHGRHVRRLAEVHQRRRLPGGLHRQIIPRNACRAPWTNTLDGRFGVQLPYKRFKTEITLDVLNLINLIDSDKGLILQYSSFNEHAAAVARAERHRRWRHRSRATTSRRWPRRRSRGSTATTCARAGRSSSARASGSNHRSFFIQTPGPSLRARRCVVLGATIHSECAES